MIQVLTYLLMIDPIEYVVKLKGKKKDIAERFYEGQSSRKIINETGYDRDYVWKTISDLKRDGLMPRTRSPQINTAGSIKTTSTQTPEGRDVATNTNSSTTNVRAVKVTFEEMEPKAFALFRKGKLSTDIVIALQIPADWAEKMHANFIRLSNFDTDFQAKKEEFERMNKDWPELQMAVQGLLEKKQELEPEVKRLETMGRMEARSKERYEKENESLRQLIAELEAKPIYETFQRVFHESAKIIFQSTLLGEFALHATLYGLKTDPSRESLLKAIPKVSTWPSNYSVFLSGAEFDKAREWADEINSYFARFTLEKFIKEGRIIPGDQKMLKVSET